MAFVNDDQWMNFSLVIGFLFTLTISWILWDVFDKNRRLPPGPLANWVPFVGYLPFLQFSRREPQDIMCRLAEKYGKIFHLKLGSTVLIVIADHKLFRDAFRKEEMSRRSLPASMDVMDGLGIVHANGDRWKNQRTFVQSIFRRLGMVHSQSHQKIEFETKAMAAIGLFLEEVGRKEGEPFDVEFQLAYTVLNIFYSTVMGKTFEPDDPNLISQVNDTKDSFRIQTILTTGNFIPLFRIFPSFKRIVKITLERRETTRNFFRTIVDEKRLNLDPENPSPDLVSTFLLQMEKDEKEGKTSSFFTEIQLLSIMGDLTSAGLETTKTAIQWVLLAILNKPFIQTKLHDELDAVIGRERSPSLDDRQQLPYVEATTLETFRYCTILPTGLNHNGIENTIIEGYLIPRDANVTGLIWKFHRDPKLWKNPYEFDPENHIADNGSVCRGDFLVPFSTGRRMCLGEEIARNEIFLVVTSLLQKFDILPVEGERIPTLDEAITGVLRCPLPFKIRAVPRS